MNEFNEQHLSRWRHLCHRPLAALAECLQRGSAAARMLAMRCVVLAVSLAAFAVAYAVTAAPAAAAQVPQVRSELLEEKAYATRAHLFTYINTGGVGTIGQWSAAYAPAEEGHEPPANSSSWVAAGGATFSFDEEFDIKSVQPVAAGAGDHWEGLETGNFASFWLHHLIPETTYYVRFRAEDEAGTGEHTFEFKTTAITRPELGSHSPVNPEEDFQIVFGSLTQSTVKIRALIETNGANSAYHVDYSTSESGPWTPFTTGASGSITSAEDFAIFEAEASGLQPRTQYYARITASNEKGTLEKILPFKTATDRAVVDKPVIRDLASNGAHFAAALTPNGSKTEWSFEYSPTSSPSGPWKPVPGAAGTLTQAEAEALGAGIGVRVSGSLSALNQSTTYYVRLFAKNAAGEGCIGSNEEPISESSNAVAGFTTTGSPIAATLATHALDAESQRLLASINPESAPTTDEQTIALEGAPTGGSFKLTFAGQTTKAIAFNATSFDVERALAAIIPHGVYVAGGAGGPYLVFFEGIAKAEPQIEADAAGLTPAGSIAVKTVQQGGVFDDARYHFEYVDQKHWEAEGGFASPATQSTSPEDAGGGTEPESFGADLPNLEAGETYRYRVVVTNSLRPGGVFGAEQSLTVPAVPAQGSSESCDNAAFRTGASAALPDCRAYEQLTPPDKNGAPELFNRGTQFGTGYQVGEDGQHVMVENGALTWGIGPRAGASPYFFSRDPAGGWQMASAVPQPETGIDVLGETLYNADLTQIAFTADFSTSSLNHPAEVAFRTGPPGGPYVTVATAPRREALTEGGWVAADADFSKLILSVEDRQLLGPEKPTGTKSGDDLFEYVEGQLRQLNVDSSGKTIGNCGARMARGEASAADAVSSDGSRVFFEAAPTKNECSGATHLYMRVHGATTVDIGAYRFLATDPNAERVLLEAQSGGTRTFALYDTGAESIQPLPGFPQHGALEDLRAAQDLSAVYFTSAEELTPDAVRPQQAAVDLYRYDLATDTLQFLDDIRSEHATLEVTADGRYLYFTAAMAGALPANSLDMEGEASEQLYRYDNTEHLLQCASCASSFNPAPAWRAIFNIDSFSTRSRDRVPAPTFVSANGDYAFFDTVAALVPQDIDGEAASSVAVTAPGREYTASSDVYEWRRVGIDGCQRPQGCLALISGGRGGFLTVLLGSADEGRDVFFYTSESLLPSDKDTAGDVYDARIGGGSPEEAGPVECEGDACSTPPDAPIDATPSSLVFSGPGNISAVLPVSGSTAKHGGKQKVRRRKRRRRRGRRGRKASLAGRAVAPSRSGRR